jgi:shikimate kinase
MNNIFTVAIEEKSFRPHTVFLIGMMGTGKSFWAQRLSDEFQIDWVDLDSQIEKAAEMTIREIFETKGEEYFRKKERDVLQQLSSFDHLIIATGGGTPCFYNNMQWMNKNGVTIWIDESIDVLMERLKKGKAHRPLIKHLSDEEMYDFLSKKLEERRQFYSLAQYHLTGEQISQRSFAEIIKDHE